MCLIALAIGVSRRWPLVIAANRDESHARPTQALQWWSDPVSQTRVLGGRDLRDGGAWMVQNDQGRLALLTNVRQGLPVRGRRSRGLLTLAWLKGESIDAWQAAHQPEDFGACNVLLADAPARRWWCLSNRDSSGKALDQWSLQSLEPGLHTVSNAQLNAPWPKALQLQQELNSALLRCQAEEPLIAQLLTALARRDLPWGTLPDTGVGELAERALAPVFVHWPQQGYGTRTSTILLDDGQGRRWLERRFDAGACVTGEARFRVALNQNTGVSR